jgi:hypothetical protein
LKWVEKELENLILVLQNHILASLGKEKRVGVYTGVGEAYCQEHWPARPGGAHL